MSSEVQKNRLTAKDICNIIRTCGKSGLTKLEYDGLRIEFGDSTTEIVGIKDNLGINHVDAQMPLPFPVDENSETVTEDDPYKQSVDDMYLSTVDPVGWERKHLEDNNDAEVGYSEA